MNTQNVVVVLARPEESRNVGAVCRAMANCDVEELRIVGKKTDFDDQKVRTLAIHAAELWENAQFFDSITEATSDCSICAGTTRRRGKKRGRLLLPEEFAKSVSEISENAKIAVVFGNERTGLTEEEINECSIGVTIPSSENFSSLNLSHAVQIILYSLFRMEKLASKSEIIDLARLDCTVNKISSSLLTIGLFKNAGKEDFEHFCKKILSRSSLTEGEAKYIEQTFAKIAGVCNRS